MIEQEKKFSIQSAIRDFSENNLTEQSISLFKTLGYNTKRRNPFTNKTYREFQDNFGDFFAEKKFNEAKALTKDWKYIDLLFQLTKNEVSDQENLFNTGRVKWEGEDKETVIETYLFFVVELIYNDYSRSQLAQITREINKIFPMPAMLLFKYGDHLTFSIISRRLNKKDTQKDVLEKVTLIKDISIKNPHRAHLEILFDLSFDELKRNYKFTNFVELHNAWQDTLDIKELNKKFYRELSNWYFWAINKVSFPNDVSDDTDDTKYNSESIIRLITRLIFIWFIKEKNLIPDKIFNENELLKIIKDFGKKGSKVYYRAILQNLFFATLNQKIEDRKFANDGGYLKHRVDYGIKNLYRYADDFLISKEEVIELFKKVPFLNGGLFDCLDRENHDNKVIYLDGFSRNPKKQAQVPDELFFSQEKPIDLSDVYSDKRKKNEKVKGLFNIFSHYKFTVAENTPIEEEVALDPELLGRVFENLLASYNPETKITARKQTGSFYTPREIVNYMVDESLKAYLKQKLETEARMETEDAEYGLEVLLGYNEKDHLFNAQETHILVKAIDNCKIIDPACGSGAFPMGILHKLVFILQKLDPQNDIWRKVQLEKTMKETEATFNLGDKQEREERLFEINNTFDENISNPDYARKLFLIENCIYGVDIQPVAAQISKLRFFISLVIDQKTDKNKDNLGIIPLPNLETKFVTANTLIGIDKPKVGEFVGSIFDNIKVKELEEKIKEIRHKLFRAKTAFKKRELREDDQKLRKEMSKTLKNSGWSNKSARQLAAWDPYDQNASSPFFDPEWMFGIKDGFDIVIANPPYIRQENIDFKDMLQREYVIYNSISDLYTYFYEKGFNILRKGGVLTYITSNKFLRARYGIYLRKYLKKNITIKNIINFGSRHMFEAITNTLIFIATKEKNDKNIFCYADDISAPDKITFSQSELQDGEWTIEKPEIINLKSKIEKKGTLLKEWNIKINRGILTGYNEAFIITEEIKNELIKNEPQSKEVIKPIIRGRDIKKYHYIDSGKYLIAFHNGYTTKDGKKLNPVNITKYPVLKEHLDKYFSKLKNRQDKGITIYNLRDCAFMDDFSREKIIWIELTNINKFAYSDKEDYLLAGSFFMVGESLKYLLAFLNSKLCLFYFSLICNSSGMDTIQWKKFALEKLPIMRIDNAKQQPFIEMVDKINNITKQSDYTINKEKQAKVKELEKRIDLMFYQLYEFTNDEIEIIESST